MLTPSAMGNGSASVYYYTNVVNRTVEGVMENAGYWMGKGAEKLELGLEVKTAQFLEIFKGYNPKTGDALVQNAGKKSRDTGWDLTMSAPKSVSVAWAIGTEKERSKIENAHREAVKTVVTEFEKLIRTRAGKGGKKQEAAGAVVAVFEHTTARPVDGQIPDPQLHSHALFMNVGVTESDGKTRSIRSELFYKRQMEMGRLYRGVLAQELKRAGFEVTHKKDNLSLKHIPEELSKEMSKRSEQIDQATNFSRDSKVRGKAAIKTRGEKVRYARDFLLNHWKKVSSLFMSQGREEKPVMTLEQEREKRIHQHRTHSR
jgi:conjugative relaxase-like TrwC/TraI family protein